MSNSPITAGGALTLTAGSSTWNTSTGALTIAANSRNEGRFTISGLWETVQMPRGQMPTLSQYPKVLSVLTDYPKDIFPVWIAYPALSRVEWVEGRWIRIWMVSPNGTQMAVGPNAALACSDTAEAQESLETNGCLPDGWCSSLLDRRGWINDNPELLLATPGSLEALARVAALGNELHMAENSAKEELDLPDAQIGWCAQQYPTASWQRLPSGMLISKLRSLKTALIGIYVPG